MFSEYTNTYFRRVLEEDIRSGDITTMATISENSQSEARIYGKEPLTVCGHGVSEQIISLYDHRVNYEVVVEDGKEAEASQTLALLKGSTRSLLTLERTLLNFMQRLSAIASVSKRLNNSLKDLDVVLLDTRKTTPGMRELERYAVTTGGGKNHRFGLFDAFLIKDNHIDANNGSVAKVIELCRTFDASKPLEVEVRNEKELREAVRAEPDIILLDNMNPEEVRRCVIIVKEQSASILLEASGGICEANLRDYAETGVDRISLGMLTHSVGSKDISLELVQ